MTHTTTPVEAAPTLWPRLESTLLAVADALETHDPEAMKPETLGLRLGVKKSAVYRDLSALREAGMLGRTTKWRHWWLTDAGRAYAEQVREARQRAARLRRAEADRSSAA